LHPHVLYLRRASRERNLKKRDEEKERSERAAVFADVLTLQIARIRKNQEGKKKKKGRKALAYDPTLQPLLGVLIMKVREEGKKKKCEKEKGKKRKEKNTEED